MILFLDTETTGLPKVRGVGPKEDPENWPRLVEIAWAVGDSPVAEDLEWFGYRQAHYLIFPDGWEIPPEATAVHGITTEQCRQDGVMFAWALEQLAQALESVETVVAHNAEFDLSVIEAECLRYGLANPLEGREVYCTKEQATEFCAIPSNFRHGRRYKWPSLAELHRKLFGREVQEAHRADSDVKTLIECYWGLRTALNEAGE